MKSARKYRVVVKKLISTLLAAILLLSLLPTFEIPLFSRALAAGNPAWVPDPTSERVVTDATELKAALENPNVTTIYLGNHINLRTYGLSGANNINSNTSDNSYTNGSNLMRIAVRTDKQVTLVGTDPKTGNRYTFTDRRSNNRDTIPFVLPNTAMTFTFKDIDIYGYNYYGLLYGGDGVAFNVVFDGVYGIMPQYLYLPAATITVRNSILKVRDTGLRTAEEFFQCGNVRVEGNVIFDDQATTNTTMFYVMNSSNRSLTIADNANVTLIERGYNSYGILYPAGNSLILGEGAKLTSLMAEREDAKGLGTDTADRVYTSGYNYGSSTRTAEQSQFTFSGSEAHASVIIGARSELNIIHAYNTTHGREILHTTTSAGITIHEGGILNVYSKANNSRVLDTPNLTLNNPRLVTLYTESSNNYLFDGTVPVKATKLKSIRYYNTAAGSYSVAPAAAPFFSGIESLSGYTPDVGKYEANRTNPNTWLFQTSNSFDVTSANINGTGAISSSTYSGAAAVPGVSPSLTSAVLNASQMRVVQIDGDYSRPPTISQAEADQTSISGTGVPGAKVNLYDPSGAFIGDTTVLGNGSWTIGVPTPLVQKTVYSATQQANIAGYYSSPSTQVTMTVNAKAFRLIATNNTQKTYMTGYLNAGFNNFGGVPDYTIENLQVIIFNNPDQSIPAEPTGTEFSTAYGSIGSNGIAYTVNGTDIPKSAGLDDYMSVGRLIQYNCAVWAKATIKTNNGSTTTVLYDSVRYKNIFTPYKVWLRAVIAETPLERLYDYETVNPLPSFTQYGVPRMGDGSSIYSNSPYPYDEVSLTAASTNLAHKEDLVGHWTATVGTANRLPVPYPLTLGSGFDTDTTLFDGDPSKYTLNYTKIGTRWEDRTVHFVDTSGNLLSIDDFGDTGTISIPLRIDSSGNAIAHMSANNDADSNAGRLSFHMLGGRYIPPRDSDDSPVGWYVASGPPPVLGTIKPQTDFNADTFNPIFYDSSDVLYIVYEQGRFAVAEEYYYKDGATETKIDTDKLQYFQQGDGGSYDIKPKTIAGYVPTGWEIVGGTDYPFDYDDEAGLNSSINPTSNQNEIFPLKSSALADLYALVVSGKARIKFFYTLDSQHNGIPDLDEGQVTFRWRGTTVDGSAWSIQPFQTIHGRKNKSISVPNTYLDLNYPGHTAIGQTGIDTHAISNTVIPSQPLIAQWVFDEAAGGETKSGVFKENPMDTDDVYFNYAFATDGTNKDKEQFVTEMYYGINNTDTDTGAPIADSTKTYILRNSAYSKMPPVIPGYIYVGYRWDSLAGSGNQIVYQNGLAPPPVSENTGNLQNDHTVTFLYRPAASGSVTVNWIGETYAGTRMQFSTVHKTGYAGEEIKIKYDDAAIASGWDLIGGYWNDPPLNAAKNTTNELVFSLDNTPQVGAFLFKEAFDEVKINAIYRSDDNSLNFNQAFPPTLANSTEMIEIMPFQLNGYVLTAWVSSDLYGNVIQESGPTTDLTKPVIVNPAKGSQTVEFSYKSMLTSLYIRCYDGDGQEIAGTAQKISNVSIGETFYAKAPIVEVDGVKYALRSDEPLIKSTNIVSGTNTILFNYVKITNSAYIILKEAASTSVSGADEVFGYRIHSYSTGQTVPAPVLTSSYYTFADTDNKSYNGSNPIEYKYTKNKKGILIQPVDEGGTSIGTPKYLSNVGRVGEMYEAVCDIIVPGYTLADAVKKKIYVDPATTPVTAKFTYRADEIGDVKVISYYGSLGNANNLDYRLGEYTVRGIVGGKLIINAETFAGFTVNGVNVQEVMVEASNTTIYFQYTDDRRKVTVKHYKSDGTGGWDLFTDPGVTDTEISVMYGENAAVTARAIPGYTLTGYSIDTVPPGGGVTPVTLGTAQVTVPFVIASSTVVHLCYTETGTAINDQLVPVTVRGVSGGTTLYEYTVNRVKNSGSYTVNAQNVFGYTLAGGEASSKAVIVTASASPNPVIFQYDSLSTEVTVKAVRKGTSDPVPGFAEFTVPAVKGQPFSYNAPYIPGWNLDGSSITQVIGSVSDTTKTVTFQYTQASGNVTVVLKEDGPTGRIIKTESVTVAANTTTPISVPNLTASYYTATSTAETVTYTGAPLTVEYYYTKQTRPVSIQRYNKTLNSAIGAAVSMGSYRIGEVSSFSAPVPISPYKLEDAVQRLELIADTITVPGTQIVRFDYVTTQTTDLVVNAVEDGTNNLLYTYTLEGTQNNTVNVPAPYVPGYVIQSNEQASKVGTFGGSAVEFRYEKNTSVVTVRLVDFKGGDISYLASAGFRTSYDVEKGRSHTVVAPNLTGYVLTGGQASQITLTSTETNTDQVVTFVYRTVSDLYVTHTIIGKDKGTNTELYKYSFSALKGAGNSTYTAAVIPGYNCAVNVKTLPNSDNGVIEFEYTIATETVTVVAKEKGKGAGDPPLLTVTFTDAIKDQPYVVRAPYVEAGGKIYALDAAEPLYKPVDWSTSKTVEFTYTEVSSTDVVIELRETGGDIIRLIKVESGKDYYLANNGIKIKELLKEDYFTYDGTGTPTTTAAGGVIPEPITSSSAAGMYTFYYTKDTRNIVVVAMEGTNEISRSTVPGVGRAGEMYTAVARSILGYFLNDQPSQTVYVNPSSSQTVVVFQYSKLAAADVKVTAYYMDKFIEHTLFEYTVAGSVTGSLIEVDVPPGIDGWKLKPGQTNPQEHTITGVTANDSLKFEYVMKTASVTTQFVDEAGAVIAPPVTQSVQAGLPVALSPPLIDGYAFVRSAYAGFGPTNQVYLEGQTYTLRFIYRRTTNQSAVMFMYLDTEGRQLDAKYVSGTLDSEIGVLSVTPEFDLNGYRLTKVVLSDGTITNTYTDNFDILKAKHGLHTTVTLTYVYMGVVIPPTNGGSATVTPPHPRPGETVTVTITPEDGYELASLTIAKSDDGSPIPYSPSPPVLGADGTYKVTYLQPDGGAIVKPQFRAKGSGNSSVVVGPTENGSVTVDPRSPGAGETVTVILTPNHGYDLETLTITGNADGQTITYSPYPPQPNPDGTYTVTYTQPDGGATVDAAFKKKSPFNSSVDVGPTEDGSVTVNPSDPASGTMVTLILTPNTGYDLCSLSIIDGNGINVSFTGPAYQNNGTYMVTYMQPANGATVNAQFVPSVLIRNTVGGTVAASTYSPWPLETVTISIKTKPGYVPVAVKVSGVNVAIATPLLSVAKTTITLTPVYYPADGTYRVTYRQPFYGAVIETQFSGTGDAEITIVPPPPDEGTIEVTPKQPKPGQEITVTITPKTEYDLKSVSIVGLAGQVPYTVKDNGSTTRSYTVTYVQPDGAVSISAEFIRSIRYGDYSNGIVSTNTTDPWPGDTVVITAAPDSGYDLSTIQITDVHNKPVAAVFTINPDGTYTITYTQPMGGATITPVFAARGAPVQITVHADNGAVRYMPTTPRANETVTVYTTANYGYALYELTITTAGGVMVSTVPGVENGTFTYTQPGEDITISAVFLPCHFSMNITNGLVILDPANPQPGQIVSMAVRASQGYKIDDANLSSWLTFHDDAGAGIFVPDLSISGNEVTFTWPADEFELWLDIHFPAVMPASGKVTVTSIGNGLVSVDDWENPLDGQKIIITAMPGLGYMIESVTVVGSNGRTLAVTEINDGIYSYIHPSGSAHDTVTVVFTQVPLNITVAQSPHGALSAPTYSRSGESVTVTITPDPEYTANFLKVDGEIVALKSNGRGGYTAMYTQPILGSLITAEFVKSIEVDYNRADGIVEIANSDPLPGTKVNVTVTPRSGYVLDSLFINGSEVRYTLMTNGQYLAEYTQPLTGGSLVKAAFKPSAASISSVVTLASNGNIDVSQSIGLSLNDPVSFTVTPDDGYKLIELTVMDKGGNPVTFSGSSSYTYSQPVGGSIIYAQFESINSGSGGNTIIIIDNSNQGGTTVAPKPPTTTPPTVLPPEESATPPVIHDDSDVSALLNTDDHMAYVTGGGDGKFSPNANMSRAEVAQIFYNLLREKNVHVMKTFPDVPEGAWYARAVNTLASLGIISGLPDGKFHPELMITRAEFATLVVKFAKLSPGGMSFNDVPASHWAYEYINTAANFGWVTGVGDGNFAPNRNITRAEAVVLMNKVLKRYCDIGAINGIPGLNQFTDVGTDHWAYYHIVEASNAHDYDLNGVTETWK